MIVSSDIANILYRDCKSFGIQIVPDGETLTGEITAERIVIHAKSQQPGRIWKKGFVEVNLCVPDLGVNSANSIRLGQLERQAQSLLDDIIGSYDGTHYYYGIAKIGREQDTNLKCHYVNVRLLFEILNVK